MAIEKTLNKLGFDDTQFKELTLGIYKATIKMSEIVLFKKL